MIIGVDVDLTVVNPSEGLGDTWYKWLEERSNYVDTQSYFEDKNSNCLEYNISSYFDLKEGVKATDFWKQRTLYDTMELYPDAVEVLNRLIDQGHEVVFVSMCKGDHHKSKYAMLERSVPRMSGFVNTKQKKFVKVDVFVDDRNDFLNQVESQLSFKMRTPYTQSEALYQPVVEVNDWYELEKVFNWHTN